MGGSKRKNRKTLKQGTKDDDELASETKTFSFPIEIIQEILSRLPAKPLLQFRSVSKQWLSLISNDPSFHKLHSTRSLTTAFFISAYDSATKEIHFLSAPHHGGPVTHLITIRKARKFVSHLKPNIAYDQQNFFLAAPRDSGGHVTHLMAHPKFSYLQCKSAETQHLNGLILFTTGNNESVSLSFALIINPTTRHIYKLPPPPYVPNNSYQESQIFYFFGFDESVYEHKVLNMRVLFKKDDPSKISIEFMVFCLSDYSWRKIDVEGEIPITICGGIKRSVCVNSVIHMMLKSESKVLAFDLNTYKFEIIEIPRGAIPHELSTSYHENRLSMVKSNCPFLVKTNGLLALVCHDRVVERNEMDIWILQDYQNRVWVREAVVFSKSWIKLGSPFPLDFLSKDEIMFSLKTLPYKRIGIPVYDIKSGRFKSVKFILGDQFPNSKNLVFGEVRSYIESIMPLKRNETVTP